MLIYLLKFISAALLSTRIVSIEPLRHANTDGNKELAGTDVNTVFRLLKNSVSEKTGLNAYALFSAAAIEQMRLENYFDASSYQNEEIEHIGPIKYVVHPLLDIWHNKKKTNRHYITRDEDLIVDEGETTLPISPDAAFTLCTQPEMRQQWMTGYDIKIIGGNGRVEQNTIMHCHHGKRLSVFEIIDWRPGEYYTGVYRLPFGGSFKETADFRAVTGGTRIRIRFGRATAENILGKIMIKIIEPIIRKDLEKNLPINGENLEQISARMITENPSMAYSGEQQPNRLNIKEIVNQQLSN